MPRWTIERPDIEKFETSALGTSVVAYITHHTGTKLLIERQAPSQLVFAKRVAEGIRGHAKIDRPHFQLFRRPAHSAGNCCSAVQAKRGLALAGPGTGRLLGSPAESSTHGLPGIISTHDVEITEAEYPVHISSPEPREGKRVGNK